MIMYTYIHTNFCTFYYNVIKLIKIVIIVHKIPIASDFGVMPVLNQYIFQYWRDTDVQYRASTDGKLPAKLPFGAAPVVDRAYASTMPVPHHY